MNPILLKAREAAQLLSVSKSFVYKLISSGEIETVRIGAAVRIPASEVERIAGRPLNLQKEVR